MTDKTTPTEIEALERKIKWLRGLSNKAWEPEDYADIEDVCEAAQSSMKQREVDHGDRLSACVKHCRALVKHLADMDSGSTDAMAINAVCDDLMKQREVVEGLITALQNLMHVIENCSVTAGHCFCGDSMDRHSHPMDCGHTATDMGAKYADDAYETGKQALAAAEKIGGK